MDFVVVGFGLGALGLLLGVVMLGWLAPRSRRAAARASSRDDAVRWQAIAAEHHATGQALLYSGGTILLATLAALASSLDDRTGALLVTTTATVAAIGILLAGYLQRARNPVPPRRRARSAPVGSATMVTAPSSDDTPLFLADEQPWVQNAVPAEGNFESPPTADFPLDKSGGEVAIVEELAPSPPPNSGEDSSSSIDLDPGGGSLIVEETTDSGSWHPADQAAGSTSVTTDMADVEDAGKAWDIVSTARSTRLSSSGTDEEDPPPGHKS
ncbi:MAG TPA: hypothetical protein VHG52_06255 [Thermomicrobiales bacterium]|nr:hypothetical protein [Thermomicrobiales bacterium]